MAPRAENCCTFPAHQGLKADYARLLFNFLRISPSYALICQSSGQKITRATPARSKQVIQAYRKYGNVYALAFDQWAGPDPLVSGKTTAPVQALIVYPGQTIHCPDDQEGILFPKDLSKAEKRRVANRLIKSLPAAAIDGQEPNIRPKTLWKALATVYERAKHPEAELWRIGLLANLVERFTGRLDPWCKKKLAKDAEMRRHLTLMVVRAIFLALLVSENAAQGFFPGRAPIFGEQMEFPFAEHRLYGLLSSQGDTEYLAILDRAGSPIKSAQLPPFSSHR
jgi:hypothetical protein